MEMRQFNLNERDRAVRVRQLAAVHQFFFTSCPWSKVIQLGGNEVCGWVRKGKEKEGNGYLRLIKSEIPTRAADKEQSTVQ